VDADSDASDAEPAGADDVDDVDAGDVDELAPKASKAPKPTGGKGGRGGKGRPTGEAVRVSVPDKLAKNEYFHECLCLHTAGQAWVEVALHFPPSSRKVRRVGFGGAGGWLPVVAFPARRRLCGLDGPFVVVAGWWGGGGVGGGEGLMRTLPLWRLVPVRGPRVRPSLCGADSDAALSRACLAKSLGAADQGYHALLCHAAGSAWRLCGCGGWGFGALGGGVW
jgi:hypothetical protein